MDKKCTLCQEIKPISEFNKKKASTDGKQNVCRLCNRLKSRNYYAKNKHKHVKVVIKNTNSYRNRNREYLYKYLLQHPCIDCGNSDVRVLEFDHRPGEIKIDGVAKLAAFPRSLEIVKNEVKKCDIRCKNCHTIKTYERLGGTWHDVFILGL